MRYRRSDVPGASYFFTVVTYGRHPLLARAEAVAIFESARRSVNSDVPSCLKRK